MLVNSLVIDDFYANPDEVRAFALSQKFEVTGNFPGYRTVPLANEETKKTIESFLMPFAGKITEWDTEYTGSFQYTTARDRSWIHSDNSTEWAGVLYLTPDAPISGGTGIFMHKETGSIYRDKGEPDLSVDGQDYTKWEIVDRFGNLYNRLILYRGNNYHVSLDYFGKTKEDGRLFQTFFFNTER